VDADGHAHQHVLRALNNLAVHLQQIGVLKGLKKTQEPKGTEG
jgi:hypothetical protein